LPGSATAFALQFTRRGDMVATQQKHETLCPDEMRRLAPEIF